ncbi:HNH endonuclease [uncultured Paraglaciecola sp.]|uniref:HNH endonuclease n=1 Tax=uncultured Paraglaciecola sp. TaxID=1765024 RepID=UPI00260CB31E|nr:HNH endonuclease [uncultured Paraglaciecola sp.]
MTDDAKKLLAFLEANGAAILETTNPYEQARFKTVNGVCVIYKNSKGAWSFSNDHARDAFFAFRDGKKWSGTKRHQRVMRKKIEDSLIERDGKICCYCGGDFSEAHPPTLEHFLSISHGGNNHFSNLALCHEECNLKAGDLPVIEKMNLKLKPPTKKE